MRGIDRFFAFVVLSSAEAVRRLRARPCRHRGDRRQGAAADRGGGARTRAPTTCCGSSAPMWGSTRTRPRGRPSAVAGPYWAAELGRDALVARQLSRRGATLYVRPDGERVRIAGHATTVLTGAPVLRSRTMGVRPGRTCEPWSMATRPRRRGRWRPRSASWPSSSVLDRPCDEHADPTHVTASGIVVGRRGTVLHLHKRLGIWMQPGGHIDAGETPATAALREATEELGLAVEHPAGRPAPDPPRRPRGGPRPHPPRPALPPARRDADPHPAAGREPRRPLVRLGRGPRHGRRRRSSTRCRWPAPPTRVMP